MESNWGIPTSAELNAVIQEVLSDSELLKAINTLYGVSKEDSEGLQRVVRSAMMDGYIRRIDGVRWGTDQAMTKIKLAERQQPKGSSGPVGTDEYRGQIIRKDGSVEEYFWINTGKWGGRSFYISLDMDGKSVREVSLSTVSKIDITGPTGIYDQEGHLLRNVWAKARITLRSGKVLGDSFLNITGIGGAWQWCYKTDLWLGNIDENVATITFNPKGS